MKFIRKVLNKLFSVINHTLLPNWQLEQWEKIQHMKKLFKMLDIDCVIDVGANKGQYYTYIREVLGYKKLVISFDPIPENISVLRQKSQIDSKLEVHELALGCTAGEKEFNIMAHNEFSSFHDPTCKETASFKDFNKIDRKIAVKMETLDSLLPDIMSKHQVKNIFLKMDTQGYDLEVLKGLSQNITKVKAIQSEIPILKLYEGAPNLSQSIDYLIGKDFFITGLFAVNRDKYLRIFDIDCVLVNKTECRDKS